MRNDWVNFYGVLLAGSVWRWIDLLGRERAIEARSPTSVLKSSGNPDVRLISDASLTQNKPSDIRLRANNTVQRVLLECPAESYALLN
jgi:hypothetical protein